MLIYEADIDEGWYVYSQYLDDGGPIPTSFFYDDNENAEVAETAEEIGKAKSGFDSMFEMEVTKYANKVTFKQKVKIKANTSLTGYITYMTCDDAKCLPPTDEDFSFDLTLGKAQTTDPPEEAAIENAQQNASDNNIRAQYICGKMEDKIQDFKDQSFDTLIINPPRKGCTNKVLDALGQIKSKKIIYVSCNPATISRDIKYLEAHNYKLKAIQAVDMFPHSFHFETIAILDRE